MSFVFISHDGRITAVLDVNPESGAGLCLRHSAHIHAIFCGDVRISVAELFSGDRPFIFSIYSASLCLSLSRQFSMRILSYFQFCRILAVFPELLPRMRIAQPDTHMLRF